MYDHNLISIHIGDPASIMIFVGIGCGVIAMIAVIIVVCVKKSRTTTAAGM